MCSSAAASPRSPAAASRTSRRNRRGFWSLWIFLALFVASLFAEFIANDRPLLVDYDGSWYFPVLRDYPETTFGGFLPTAADYRDPAVKQLIDEKGWMVWPLIPFDLPHDHRRARPLPGGAVARPTGSAPTTRAATCWPG